MSRPAASKSRADKSRGGHSAPTPAITHEIVPGKFSDLDWNFALDIFENDDFIGGLVDEVANNALSIINDRYLEKQLVPYTVAQAKDAMLILVEWQFLSHDIGETEDVSSAEVWMEDEEPPCCVVDAWGQGAMPLKVATPRLSSRLDSPMIQPVVLQDIQEEDIKIEGSELEPEEIEPQPKPEIEVTEVIQEKADTTTAEQLKEDKLAEEQPHRTTEDEEEEENPKKVKFQPYRGTHLYSAHLRHLDETLYETERQQMMADYIAAGYFPEDTDGEHLLDMPASCHSILKVQAGRPPGNKEVVYDEQGNVMSVVKIPPERLPTHRVNVAIRVVDPEVEAANRRLEAMKKGRRYNTTGRPEDSKQEAPRHLRSVAASKQRQKVQTVQLHTGQSRDESLVDPLPPSLVDSITLSAGVLVKEGDRVKKGPRQRMSQSDTLPEASIKALRPVHVRSPGPAIVVNELVPSVAIRPLGEAKPIPPINSVQ